MAEFTQHPMAWAEEHPYISAGIVVGGIVVLYWLFFSGGSKSSTDTGASQMAAAYYAAEAQQAVAGTQLNIATTQADAQVKMAAIQAGGAVAINQANATASQNIAASMYAADTTNTASTNAANVAIATVQANDAMTTANTLAGYNYLTNKNNNEASVFTTAMNTIIPQELAITHGWAGAQIPADLGGGFDITTGAAANINDLMAQGYTQAQALQYASASAGIAYVPS